MLAPTAFESEEQWHLAIMRATCGVSDAYKLAIRVPEADGFRMIPLGFEAEAIAEHKAYYHRFDFGRALGKSPMLDSVFSRNNYYGRDLARFKRTEYFCDYIHKYGAFDALCLSTGKEDHSRETVLYSWHERELSDSKRSDALAMLSILSPSFHAGMSIGARVFAARGDWFRMIDAMSEGCAVFDDSMRLLHRNAALAMMPATPAGELSLLSGMRSCAQGLMSVRGSNGSLRDLASTHASVLLDGATYCIRATFIECGFATSRMILVTTNTTRARPHARQTAVKQAFCLTAREAEVARLLNVRRSNHEIARELGVSEHTARHHTENVLRKLAVKSRREVSAIFRELDGPRSVA
jgi:DNA-binding CsgD family transcriptional regulator